MLRLRIAIALTFVLLINRSENHCWADDRVGPFQASGIKIGEVDDHSAIIWTRLTLRPERNPTDGPEVRVEYIDQGADVRGQDKKLKGVYFPDGVGVESLKEAVPGSDGEVRVRYRTGGSTWSETNWKPVEPMSDFTYQVAINNLSHNSNYEIQVESRSIDGKTGATLSGQFRTAPHADQIEPLRFAVVTCFGHEDQDCPEGFKLYRAISKLKPHFFVHTGDIVYYDELAKSVDLARYHWQRTYSLSTNLDFHRTVSSYFMKDDHDVWQNDCWPTMQSAAMGAFTFSQGQKIFLEQVPMGKSTYRTFRWGKDLQIWMVEGRDFRSSLEDTDGPEKTIWGNEQKAWFKRTVAASNATFRVLISPTPVVGPDRKAKKDNHANSGYTHEGKELRQFLADNQMQVICGDRHWQYHSVDPVTKLKEYSVGPGSDPHAGGWKQEDYFPDYHRYLRVAGGFLSVQIERLADVPTMTLQFHDTDGNLKFEDVVRKR